jgi:uncharacterized protein YbbC (DUF1343 family)
MSYKVKTGLDLLEKAWPKSLKASNIGLLVHPASINSQLKHSVDICMQSKKFKVKTLFGPQHGIRGETQDNMIEWEGFNDKKTGIQVYSLYGKTRKALPDMLKNIDIIVIDLQDIGARYYTFVWTMALMMESCQQLKKTIVVLDRPNPIGGHIIEGPVLRPTYKSFVGLHKMPVRHGMSIAEIALYLNDHFYPKLDLHVIQMRGWKRTMWFDDTGLPWVFPSPNIPTINTASVYPGMCLLEGTNLSEGRGTTRPFEVFGAPFIDPFILVNKIQKFRLPGLFFRPMYFLPTFHKHAGKICGGSQIHIIDREKFKPFKTAVAILKSIYELYPNAFSWKNPPYEYEEKLLPIDILSGTDRLRKDIENSTKLGEIEAWWNNEITMFDKETRRKYLIYQ